MALVTLYYPPLVRGGSHVSAFEIAKAVGTAGHEVDVFTAKLGEGTVDDQVGGAAGEWETPGVTVKRIFSPGYPSSLLRQEMQSRRLAAALNQYFERMELDYDVVHAYGMDTIPAVVSLRAGAARVASFNGSWGTCPYYHVNYQGEECLSCSPTAFRACVFWRHQSSFIKKRAAHSVLRRIYLSRKKLVQRLDGLLAISDKVKTILLNCDFDPDRIFVCHNLFPHPKDEPGAARTVRERFGIPEGRKIILYAGRLADIKGCNTLVQAIPKVLAGGDNSAHFLVVGQGDAKDRYVSSLNQAGVSENVTFGEFVNPRDMPSIYQASYCTVYPSIFFDPLPRTPIESLLNRCPVIATTRGGLEEILIDQTTGLEVSPGDPDDLSAKISSLLRDESMRRALAENGHTYATREFSAETGIQAYMSAYEAAIAGRRSRAG